MISDLIIFIIRGNRIKVCLARYEKGRIRGTGKRHPPREEWRRKQHQQENQDEAMFGRLSQEEDLSIKGEVNQDFVDWLDRSIVGTTHEPRDLQALA